MITTRKLKITIVSENRDEGFRFIRSETRQQNKALNIAYNHLYFEYIAVEKLKKNDDAYRKKRDELNRLIEKKYEAFLQAKEKGKDEKQLDQLHEAYNKKREELYKLEKEYTKQARQVYQQVVGFTHQTRIRNEIDREFELTSDTKDCITSKVKKDFTNDIKAGLLRGERSLRNYKHTHPLLVRGRSLNIYKENDDYFIKWIHGIVFKIILSAGSKQRQNIGELKATLEHIVDQSYKVSDSSISITDKELILNLALNIPVKKENTFRSGCVVGVDLGIKIPAYMSLNDAPYIKKAVGSMDDFLKVRTQIQKQRRRLQKSLQSTSGGKGGERKLKGLERIKSRERNFTTTYNHFLSKSIVQFAVKNQAATIHMEHLEFDRMKHKSLLRNWSYYQLQQMVEYKAAREGIQILYVDSRLTSQTCGKCGHYEEGQREVQDTFLCKKCGYQVNADYNASQNIANSTAIIRGSRQEKTTP